MSLIQLSPSNGDSLLINSGSFSSGKIIRTRNELVFYTDQYGNSTGYRWLGTLPHTINGISPLLDGGISSSAWESYITANLYDRLKSENITLTGTAHLPTVEVSYGLPRGSLKVWTPNEVSSSSQYWLYSDGTVWGGVGTLGSSPAAPFTQLHLQRDVVKYNYIIQTNGESVISIPYTFTSISIFLNGVLLSDSSYIINQNIITFNNIMSVSDELQFIMNNVPVSMIDYALKSDLNEYASFDILIQPDSFKYIGSVSSISQLRSIKPTVQNQRIILNSYNNNNIGSDFFYYDSLDTTTPDDDIFCIVTSTGERWKRIFKDNTINLSLIGATTSGDITTILQKAINYCDLFVRTNGFYNRPTIAINAGNYVISSPLTMPSWVSIVAFGNVNLDGSSITGSTNFIFSIKNSISGINISYHEGYNLSSIGGTLRIYGSGKTTNDASGLFVGNTSSGMTNCRNVSLSNVSIINTQNALTFGTIDTYIFSAIHCRFEQNYININSPNSTNSNSGERMTFINCTFGGSDNNHININTPGMDMIFSSSSFDFTSGNVLNYGTGCSYIATKFSDCHFEGWDGYLINSIGSGLYIAAYFNNPIFLPRARSGITNTTLGIANSPSRLLLNSNASINVYMSGIDMRHEIMPYGEDIFIANNNVILNVKGYIKDSFTSCPSNKHILNRGYDISDETVGNTITNTSSVLNRYTISSINSVTGSITTRSDGNGNQISLNGTVSGSYITFLMKDSINVLPNDRIGVYTSLQALDSTGNKIITPYISWYDSSGTLISTVQGLQTNMNTVFTTTTLPNYSTGNNRYISSSAAIFRAPLGACTAKMSCTISAFVGNINISRISMFKLED